MRAREVAMGAGAAVMLGAQLAPAPWSLAAVLVAAAGTAGVWGWATAVTTRQRIEAVTLALTLAPIVALGVAMYVGVPLAVALSAAVIGALAVRDLGRLRAAALPETGERVWFEGTLDGGAVMLPGTDIAVAVWIATQGARRWTSEVRLALRDGARRVLVDPGALHGYGTAWTRPLAALPGVDPTSPVRLWYARAGERVFVVGDVVYERDPGGAAPRDPDSIAVVRGPGGIWAGTRRRALEVIATRLALSVLAAAAAAVLALG